MEPPLSQHCILPDPSSDGIDAAGLLPQVELQRALLSQLSRNQPVPSALLEAVTAAAAAAVASQVGGDYTSFCILSMHVALWCSKPYPSSRPVSLQRLCASIYEAAAL